MYIDSRNRFRKYTIFTKQNVFYLARLPEWGISNRRITNVLLMKKSTQDLKSARYMSWYIEAYQTLWRSWCFTITLIYVHMLHIMHVSIIYRQFLNTFFIVNKISDARNFFIISFFLWIFKYLTTIFSTG